MEGWGGTSDGPQPPIHDDSIEPERPDLICVWEALKTKLKWLCHDDEPEVRTMDYAIRNIKHFNTDAGRSQDQ